MSAWYKHLSYKTYPKRVMSMPARTKKGEAQPVSLTRNKGISPFRKFIFGR